MKNLLCLRGPANCGKTESFILFYDKLKQDYPEFEIESKFKAKMRRDFCIVIKIKGKLIGIESQGDPNSRIFKSIPIFIELGCDIIFCSSRTSGSTAEFVDNLNEKYDIKIYNKNRAQHTSFESENGKMADRMMDYLMNWL